jgi:hypothetical protein
MRLAAIISHVEAYRMDARKNAVFRRMEDDHEQDVGLASQDLHAFDSETKQITAILSKQQSDRRKALLASHRAELAANTAQWESAPKLKKYTHPSPALICKRKQFDLLMKEGNYAQADLCAKDIRATEQREAGGAVNHIKAEFREATRVITARHRDELAALDAEFQAEREMVVKRRESERVVLLNVMKKLEVKGETFASPEKAWQITKKQKLVEIARSISHKVGTVKKHGRSGRQRSSVRLPPLGL